MQTIKDLLGKYIFGIRTTPIRILFVPKLFTLSTHRLSLLVLKFLCVFHKPFSNCGVHKHFRFDAWPLFADLEKNRGIICLLIMISMAWQNQRRRNSLSPSPGLVRGSFKAANRIKELANKQTNKKHSEQRKRRLLYGIVDRPPKRRRPQNTLRQRMRSRGDSIRTKEAEKAIKELENIKQGHHHMSDVR